MSTGATPEDVAAFSRMLARDPENKKCFECGYPSAPWCDINHGIFVCLECSGQHRGLGVHLSFVRSSTMDGWSNWKPEKLKIMEAGGNSKCKAFFTANDVPSGPIRTRYMHKNALLYKDKLEAEAMGVPFNAAQWSPPEWWTRVQQEAMAGASGQQQPANRYGSIAGPGSRNPASSKPAESFDFFSALSDAAATVASTASRAVGEAGRVAETAATAAVSTSRSVAQTVEAGIDRREIDKSLSAAGEAAKGAWGALSSWTSYGVTSLTTAISTAASNVGIGNDNEEEDGLAALTRNVKRRAEDDDERPLLRENSSSTPLAGGAPASAPPPAAARFAPRSPAVAVAKKTQEADDSWADWGSHEAPVSAATVTPTTQQPAPRAMPPATRPAVAPSTVAPVAATTVPAASPSGWAWDD